MNTVRIWLPLLGLATLASCSSGSKSDSAPVATEEGAVASEVTSLKDLSLTGVLALTLPASVKGDGTASGLRLAGQKSFEACKLRQEMKEGLSNIAQLASTFCFLENDPSITFGKKYSIDFSAMMGGGAGGETPTMPDGETPTLPDGAPTGGPGTEPPPGFPGLRLTQDMPTSVQIWIDNASKEKLKIYFCQDKSLSQMIEITGAKDGVAKGNVVMKQAMSFGDFSMNFHRTMAFDSKFTDADKTSITIKELVSTSSTQFGAEKARRLLSLSLSETGVSKVLSSFSGNFQGSENSFASVGAFDNDFGSVIAKGSATFPGGTEAIEFSNESFFDGKSYVVDAAAFPTAFGADGKVKLGAESVPTFLASTFAPDEFPADAWDCMGTEELTPSADASSTNSCSTEWAELGDEDCAGAAFSAGVAVEVDASKQINADELESFPEPVAPETVPAP